MKNSNVYILYRLDTEVIWMGLKLLGLKVKL